MWTISKSSFLHRFNQTMGSEWDADHLQNGCAYFWYTVWNICKALGITFIVALVLSLIGTPLLALALGISAKGAWGAGIWFILGSVPVGIAAALAIAGTGWLGVKGGVKTYKVLQPVIAEKHLEESVPVVKTLNAFSMAWSFIKATKEKYCPTLTFVD